MLLLTNRRLRILHSFKTKYDFLNININQNNENNKILKMRRKLKKNYSQYFFDLN